MATAAVDIEETRQMLNDFSLNLTQGKHKVEVVHINSPQDFYARPKLYEKYEHKVCRHIGQANFTDITPNAQVVYKSKVKGHYIRGDICTIQEADCGKASSCTIFATDYGFIEKKVHEKDIYKIDPSINIPPLIVACSLSEALPRKQSQTKWDDNAIDAFKTYLKNDETIMKVVGNKDGKYLVELSNKFFRDVAEILAMSGYSVMGIGCNTVNRQQSQKPIKHFFTYKDLKEDQTIHVRVISGKSLDSFFVADINDYKNYRDEKVRFNIFSKQCDYLKEDCLIRGQSVSVYSDTDYMYQRAIIEEVIDSNKIIVSLIDTGIKRQVSFCKIREMSEKFFGTPAVAIYCAAEKDQINDHRYLKLLWPGTEFYITIMKLGMQHQNPNVVKIWNTERFQ